MDTLGGKGFNKYFSFIEDCRVFVVLNFLLFVNVFF